MIVCDQILARLRVIAVAIGRKGAGIWAKQPDLQPDQGLCSLMGRQPPSFRTDSNIKKAPQPKEEEEVYGAMLFRRQTLICLPIYTLPLYSVFFLLGQ